MDSKQMKLMTALAKKLKAEKRNTEQILNTFISAGILNSNGKYTKNYSKLGIKEKATN